jgi:MHS family proline/betaine transporter-like MFS transporter
MTVTASEAVPEIVPEHVHTQEFHTPKAVRRGILAGVVGNMLEWYDFALFGFFAQQLGAHFFPSGNPTVSLLAAFGTFAAGFLMRPVGGALFGWIGDRFGRKQALIGSVLAMALPSFLIGCLPDAKTIGEYMASAVFLVEGSEPGRRGYMGSWGPFGASAGTLLGSAAGAIVNAGMTPEQVMAYGWRIPFLVGILVAFGGLVIRRTYVERVPQQDTSEFPLSEAFRDHWKTLVHLVGLTTGISVGFYTTFVYSATWLEQTVNVPARTALEINTVAMALLLVIIPFAGIASDRIGRRPVLAFASGGLMLLAYPLMTLMGQGRPASIFAGQVGLALLVGGNGAVLPATMAELAPWRVRCTVLSVGYNISLAILGGTTPVVAAWLVSRTGFHLAPAVYLALAAAVTFVAALLLPKTARHRMTKEFSALRTRGSARS